MRAIALTALLPLAAAAQPLVPTLLTALSPTLYESSGLLAVNGALWTHNDSDNENKLYQVDPSNGEVVREVTLTNASNVDWEAITSDGEWVYVGDFGNNPGSRTNLRIYRFPLTELTDPDVTSVLVDTIRFAYADQTDFTPANQAHNWDCEAFIVEGDSLYLFSKRWLDAHTMCYALPAWPGDHMAVPHDSLDSQGLVTDATYDPGTGRLLLLGYTHAMHPFIWDLSGFHGNTFFHSQAERYDLALPFTKTEGITFLNSDTVWISCEENFMGEARLWSLGLDRVVSVRDERSTTVPRLRPNPAHDRMVIEGLGGPARVRCFDARGLVVVQAQVGGDGVMDVGMLAPGSYTLVVSQGRDTTTHRLLIAR